MAIVSAGISAASSLASGFAQAGAAKSAQKAREQQQRIDMDLDQIAALDAEDERQDQVSRLRAANLAAQGAAGLGSNRSFIDGVNQFNQEKARGDLIAIRFNQGQRQARTELAIATDKASTKSRARNSIIGGVVGAAQAGFSGYSNYKKVSVPGGNEVSGGDFFSVGSAKAGGFTKVY
jgi:hypothetical protein